MTNLPIRCRIPRQPRPPQAVGRPTTIPTTSAWPRRIRPLLLRRSLPQTADEDHPVTGNIRPSRGIPPRPRRWTIVRTRRSESTTEIEMARDAVTHTQVEAGRPSDRHMVYIIFILFPIRRNIIYKVRLLYYCVL